MTSGAAHRAPQKAPLPDLKDKLKMIVEYTRLNLLRLETITLKPGANHGIDDETFDRESKLPKVAKLIQSGVIKIKGRAPKPADPAEQSAGEQEGSTPPASEDEELDPDVAAFLKLSAKDAVEVVNATTDLERLDLLLDHEKRATVKKALKAKIESVKKAFEDSKKPADEEPSTGGE